MDAREQRPVREGLRRLEAPHSQKETLTSKQELLEVKEHFHKRNGVVFLSMYYI